MGNQSSALDILLNRMKETGTISTSPKSTTTGLSKTEEEERFRKWQAEAEAARAAAEAKNQNIFERAWNTVTGGVKGWAGNQAGFFGNIAEGLSRLGERLGGNTSDYSGWATDEMTAGQVGMENDPVKRAQQLAESIAMQETGNRWSTSGSQDIERAKAGLGFWGGLAVDAGANAVQMGLDSITGAVTGMGGLAPLVTRAAGGAMQEAEGEGASLGQRMLYGGTVGAIEGATEKLFGGLAKIYGAGTAESMVERIVRRMTGSAAGRRALLVMADIGGEAIEELISNVANPAAKMIYNGKSIGESYKDNFSVEDALYDALIGGIMGGFGAGTKVMGAAITGHPSDYTSAVQRMGYANEAETALRSQWGNDKAGRRAARDYAELIGKSMTGELSIREQSRLETKPTAVSVLESMRNRSGQTRPGTSLETAIVRDNLREVFRQAGMQVSDAELDTMANGYAAETSSIPDYVTSMRTAYTLGKSGNFTLEQATKQAGAGASPLQFRHAFELGRGINAAEAETADIRTAEGREKVASRLSSLGESAERAADAYADGQDIARYAAAMEKAVNLYAANGADLKAIYRSKNADIIKDLTPAQVDLAQELGREAGAQLKANAEARAAELKEIQAQAAQIRMANEAKLPEINAALAAAQDQARTLRQDISGTEEGLKLARQAEPGIVNNAEYQAAEARVEQMRKDEEAVQKTIEQLQEDKKKAREESQGKRKKGTVRYETAKLRTEKGTETFEAADPKKLNRKQKKVVAMVEAVADAVNADFVLLNARSNMGGAYLQGGTIYINVNSAIGEGENARSIAAASLGHELTHYIEQYAPEEYQELKDFVVSEILKKSPAQFDALVRQQLKWEPNLSYEQAVDELVANACQSMLYNSKSVTKLARQNMNLAEKIADFIENFTQKIREAFDEIDFTEKAGVFRPVQAVMDELETIQEIWDRGLETASGNAAYRNTATEGGVQMMNYSEKQTLQEYEAQTAVYDALDHADAGDDNLIKVSRMPKFIRDLSGIDGDFYVYRDHLYEDIKTEKEAREEGRFKKRGNYHGIGEEKAVQAIMSLENPAITINDTIGRGNPEIVMVLPVIGNKGTPLIAAFGFYKDQPINGKMNRKPHIVMSIYEKLEDYNGRGAAKKDLATLIDSAIDEGRILSYDKEISDGLPVTAQRPRLGSITASSLENNVSQFRNSVNEFKKDHKINYQTFEAESEQEERQIQRVQYSVFEEDPETLAWLNKQEKDGDVVHTYKSFLEIDGKLYPPMASMKKGPDGKWKMTKAMEVGRWEKSVGDPSKIEVDPKNGRGYFTLKKDDGSTVKAAYNPYQHSSNLMINDQFTGAYSRPGLVTYECIIPKSELTSGYRAEHAKDAVGVHSWKAGPVAGKLIKAKGTERQVYLSRWLKPVRKVPDAEVAQHYKELLDGTDIAVPSNVVPPSLLHALEDAGVKIEYDPRAPKAQFQMISEVEETDKLIAVHNKSVSGLRRMLKRGGVPFPSIAIKRAGTSHQGFGDVSIVFPKSTIDPEVNRQNRLYSNDAWTPTEPRTEYEVDIPYKIKQRIEESVGSDLFTALNGYSYLDDGDVARALENSTGNLFEAMKGRRILKYAYLKSIGKEPEITQKEADLDGSHKYKNEQLLRIFEQIPADEIENANWDSDDTLKKIADVLNEQFLEKIQDPEKRERIRNSEKLMPYSADKISIGYIKSALFKYRQNGNRAGTEIDTYELDRVLRDNTEVERDPGYKAWIEKTFGKVIKNEGIPNGKDPYTSSGNRRSFKQTHVPATLENIVAQMQKEQERGIGLGGVNLRGAATRTYKTVEEMRADRGRLLGERVSDDVYDSYMKGFYGRLHDMSDRVKSGSSISAYDSAEQILLEVLRDSTSKAQMGRKLQTEGRWIRLYDGLTDELWQLKQDVQNMPAPYFEAKPRRVVYPEEALAYIIPDSSEAADVREMLKEDGRYKVLTYKAGDEADRLRVLNSVEGAQFQRWDEPGAERIRPSMEEHHWGENFPPVMYNTNLPGLNREGKALHEQAKNGDAEAARRIVARSVKPEKLSAFAKQHRGARLVAVRSEDGKNKIPYAYAAELAKYGLDIDDSIVQVAKAWHTGSSGIIRMIEHAGFDGDVKPGQEYILVDDVLTFGGTLNDLRMYIESKGGKVVACTTLAVGRNGHHLAIRPELVQQIYDKHGENIDTVLREEGIAYDVSSLTDRQGRYIRDLDVDTLRDRGAQERASEEYRGGKETGSREAEELTETGSRPVAVQYQQYDDTYEDTSEESTGRELAYSRIQSENAILSNTVKELKKTVKGKDATIEKILKKLARAKKADADKLARQIMREYSSKADLSEVTAAVKAVGDYYLQTPVEKLDEARVKELAREAASLIAQGAEETVETDNGQLREIRGSLEGQKVYIKPEFLGELDSYGGLKSVKNSLFGKRVYLSSEAGEGRISVDQLYEQLHADFGDYYFPEAGSDNGPANEGEEILIIADVLAASDSMTVNPFDAYMGEAVESIANGIAFRVMNENVLRPLLPAEAEKAFDQLGAVTEENREIRKKLDAATTRGEVIKEELERLQQEGKDTKSELIELRDQVYDLTSALKKADQRYSALQAESEQRIAQVREEGTARVAEVRAKERERAAKEIQGLKDHYKEIQKKARDRREESAGTTKYRKQVQAKAKALYEMLMKNDDKKHVPEVLKRPVAEFLESIDFTSKRQLRGGDETNADREFGARMRALERALSGQQDYIDGTGDVQEDLGGYVDISQENLQFLRDTIGLIDTALKENRDYTINQMSAAELKQLSNFLSNLNTAIRNLNSFMANARFESVREAADQDIESLKKLGKPGKFAGSAVDKFAAWENGTPYYIMKRFGEGGKSIFDGFAKGWERMAFNAKEIIDFTKKLYTDKEVNTWKNEIRDIELSDGSKVRMTTAQIMELSMLLNREQALKHIEAGGIRIGDITEKGRTIHDTTHYHLTMQDIVNITGMLNARQREVAKALQTYMAQKGAQWGNEVSMRRFGYEFYTEGENYYPIKTDANDRPMADTDAQTNSMFRLLNLSSSKSLNPKASNALVVGNIFDTFSGHLADMAKLNGMGLPILDAIKWFNFKERINYNDGTYDTRTMQGAMEQAYGTQALKYFRTLMKDINGVTESGDRGVSLPGKLMSNYKIASVGANLRVALLQPTSYVRAMTVLKPQFLAGVLPSMEAYREAMKYSGTAVWKSLGYYDTDIARGMRGQIQHDDTIRDKIASASMTLAEKGDQLTWSRLWTACKRQAKSENNNLRGQALMDRTAALFREVVYSSQVMDSTLTRSEVMRGKTNWTKAMSAFMAEPTLSYNILLDAASEYMNDTRRNGKAGAWQRNAGKIGKAFTVYVCSAAFSAVVESIADAARDDDDEKYLDKWLEAFLGEDSLIQGNLAQDLTILGKLPYIKNFISTLQGYSSSDMSTAAFSNLVNVFKIWEETIKLNNGTLDKATKITYYGRMTEWGKVYKTLQALSQLSGVAAANMTRDVTAIWNLTVGSINPDMKIRTYDSNALSESKEAAYQETVNPTGIKKSQYKNILTQADEDGNGSVKQAEMDAYLKGAVQNGELSREQAAAIWDAQGWKKSWAEYGKQGTETTTTATKKTSTANTARASSEPNGEIAGWDDFKTVAPIYGNPKKEAAYNAKPRNLSLTEYTKMLQAADADGNKSLKQDELGFALKAAVQSGQISWEAAAAVWAAQGWSHDLSWWAAKHP